MGAISIWSGQPPGQAAKWTSSIPLAAFATAVTACCSSIRFPHHIDAMTPDYRFLTGVGHLIDNDRKHVAAIPTNPFLAARRRLSRLCDPRTPFHPDSLDAH